MATADNVRLIEDVPEFTTSAKTVAAGVKDRAAFKLDDERYVLLRPKNSLAMQMLSNVREGGAYAVESERAMDYLTLVAQFIRYVEMEPPEEILKAGKPTGETKLRGQARLVQRLNDPKDDLDIQDLGPIIESLLEKLYERNPTQPPASGGRPARTSRAGAAGTRSRRAKTSTR